MQKGCAKRQEILDKEESLFVLKVGNWRQPHLDFLQHPLLPPNRSNAIKSQKKSSMFFIEACLLFRRDFNQAPFMCIAADEMAKVLQKVHTGVWSFKGTPG